MTMILCRYPLLLEISLAVVLHATPGATITRELVAQATGRAEAFDAVLSDLIRAHFVDDENRLSPLADAFARMWQAEGD